MLQGEAAIPVVSRILEQFGGGVTITVSSSARSDLE
jgi:NADPH-dependent ferric siderophore reductase